MGKEKRGQDLECLFHIAAVQILTELHHVLSYHRSLTSYQDCPFLLISDLGLYRNPFLRHLIAFS